MPYRRHVVAHVHRNPIPPPLPLLTVSGCCDKTAAAVVLTGANRTDKLAPTPATAASTEKGFKFFFSLAIAVCPYDCRLLLANCLEILTNLQII